jgi:hypothetical protein
LLTFLVGLRRAPVVKGTLRPSRFSEHAQVNFTLYTNIAPV